MTPAALELALRDLRILRNDLRESPLIHEPDAVNACARLAESEHYLRALLDIARANDGANTL